MRASLGGVTSSLGRLFSRGNKGSKDASTDSDGSADGATDTDNQSDLTSVDSYVSHPASSDKDTLFVKRGATFTVNKPFSLVCYNSGASANLEKTTTVGGKQEMIGSLSCDVGPVVKNLPFGNGAHSMLTTVSGGTRVTEKNVFLPYTSGTVVAKEIMPLTATKNEASGLANSIILALKHTLHASSPMMPLHEAQAAGCNTKIRGYGSRDNGAISKALAGAVELR